MSEPQGWLPPNQRSSEVQAAFESLQANQYVFGAVASNIFGDGAGKTVLLYKALEKIIGGEYPLIVQEIGDCVSFGFAGAIDVLKAVEILIRGEAEQFTAQTATEWIYGTSRVIQGDGRLGNSDGSLGGWAAKAVEENGTLLRKKYGSVDLSQYSGRRAKDWGYRGLPRDLEQIADEHPVKTTAIVRSYEEARDAIANGYPVAVCSDQGFKSQRDSEGFARASGTWYHCMLFHAVDDAYRRPGLCCQNSWPRNWISGPKRHEQPDGSFWVDADVADRMLRQGDSYALSNFEGYPSQTINYQLW